MPHLDRLGLKEDPFSQTVDQRYFYADQNRAQILESTEHLIEYSSNLQVILGEPGMGKSHLLETLASRIDNNWRVAKIQATEQHDTITLINAILKSLASVQQDEMDLLEVLENQLADIIQLGFKPVLFIDDADKLSSDAIRFLLQLSQQKQNDEPYINIVLFATSDISDTLQSPELKEFRDIIHIATLDKLDKEGVSGYLRHKMAVAGFDRETPFTPRIIDSIFNNSQGIPEKINDSAVKFLSTSDRAENYITPEAARVETPTKAANTHDFTAGLDDDELRDHRTDKTEEQLNRLAEKFEEIEKMGQKPVDDFLFDDADKAIGDSLDESIEADDIDDDLFDDEFEQPGKGSSNLYKYVIPVTVIGAVITAFFVLNSVFDSKQSNQEQPQEAQQGTETIELLPLELPSESSLAQNQSQKAKAQEQTAQQAFSNQADEKQQDKLISKSQLQSQSKIQSEETQSLSKPLATLASQTKSEKQVDEPTKKIELIEAKPEKVASMKSKEQPKMVSQPTKEAQPSKKATTTAQPEQATQPAKVAITPVLRKVLPEPVIGSKKRQYVSIFGKHFTQDSSMTVTWDENKKVFSKKLTPAQWKYISKSEIKLFLHTGIKEKTWKVFAQNVNSKKSNVLEFNVVKPFIETLSINQVIPNPVKGINKRQAISILGNGFTKQTVLELKWDKNKKFFSSRLTPNQFEWVSSNKIKLFVTTGTKERQWKVSLKNPENGKSSSATFLVKVDKVVKQTEQVSPLDAQQSAQLLQHKRWILNQDDDRYTVQIFGSHKKKAIDQLIKKYNLQGEMAWFATNRNEQNWYSLVYGNYVSRSAAITAANNLNPELTRRKPWVRSFGSIKKQLNQEVKLKKRPEIIINSSLSNTGVAQEKASIKDEAWIWTQNPADYTIQLLALSQEQGIKNFIKKHKLEQDAIYFKLTRKNQPLYVLIYGQYTDKASAERNRQQLVNQIKGIKPWLRSFSEIHDTLSVR